MSVYLDDGDVVLHLGDAVEVMAAMAPESVDAVVCDPPYGLEFMGKEWDALGTNGRDDLRHVRRMTEANETEKDNPWASERPSYGTVKKNPRCLLCGVLRYAPEGRKCVCPAPRWDLRITESAHVMQEWHQTWAVEALRVLKPGGHLLAFGGTRTFHRLTCAIEDAGFEVRDCLSWLYGSGFPKSLDVSKAIDKGRRRDYVAAAVRLGVALPGRSVDDWTKEDHAPGDRWWEEFKAALPSETWSAIEREVVGSASTGSNGWFVSGEGSVTAPATPEAAAWQGWGTALKPAWEPVVLARKPLAGTVAGNVLAHGTGALNIGACRVGTSDDLNGGAYTNGRTPRAMAPGGAPRNAQPGEFPAPAGRWPANVVLSHVAGMPVVRLRYNVEHGTRDCLERFFAARRLRLSDVRELRDDVRGSAFVGAEGAAEVLLEGVPERASGNGARGEAPALWDAPRVERAAQDGDSGDEPGAGLPRGEAPELEGRDLPRQGLPLGGAGLAGRDGSRAGAGDDGRRLHPGASPRDGADVGEAAESRRVGPSPERGEGGQPAGEPEPVGLEAALAGAPGDGEAAGRAGGAEPLLVLAADVPPAWRDYFEVAGHTPECREVGTRKVRPVGESAGNAYKGGPTDGVTGFGTGSGGGKRGHVSPDGTETVAAWECHPECPVRRLDEDTEGARASRPSATGTGWGATGAFPIENGTPVAHDGAGASRFFYTAKASSAERDGATHPTVKPLALMRWLVRLVTPPGGVCLDPFAGSGTTGLACREEGFRCVLIEREEEYAAMAAHRLRQLSLFGGLG